jgi:hypothetical protein
LATACTTSSGLGTSSCQPEYCRGSAWLTRPALVGSLPQAMLGPHGRQCVVQGQIHIEDLV